MKIAFRFLITTVPVLWVFVQVAFAQTDAEKIYQETCVACHTIGQGKLIGPDLANIQNRHPEEWLIRFIRSSQSVINSGDPYADSLFQAYNKIPMPDHPSLTDVQIKGLLTYIGEKSLAPAAAAPIVELPPGNSKRGRDLFVGNIRFANNGAACNACHNVEVKGLFSGGALGKDLTHAVSRLSASGVAGIISGLPFPQMKETYAPHPVTPQEIADITAFLAQVDKQAPENVTGSVGSYLFGGGITGLLVLLVLYSFFWIKRKKRPVNFSVFKRQIKSA